MRQQLGKILLTLLIIFLAWWFDSANNTSILIVSSIIVILLTLANILALCMIKFDNNTMLYNNLFENDKTKELEHLLFQKGIKVKLYTYANSNLTVSLLPSSRLTVVLSQPILNIFNRNACIDMIYHEIGHFEYRKYHISEIINISLNITFICIGLTILYFSKIILGSAFIGIIIEFPFTFYFLKLRSILKKELFLHEEFYADKYAYTQIPNCKLINTYKEMIKYDSNINKEYIYLKIKKLEEKYGTHK